MGTRLTADILSPTTLEFQFLRNGIPFTAYTIDKVTIHSSYGGAQNDTDIIETIYSSDISLIDVGTYEYVAGIISTTGTYFDKVFITPVSGGNQFTYINSFLVSTYTSSQPIIMNNCLVTGIIYSSDGQPVETVLVSAIPAESPAITSTGIAVSPYPLQTFTGPDGIFSLQLIKKVDYVITIKYLGFRQKIKVPDKNAVDLFSISDLVMNNESLEQSQDVNW